MTEITDCTTPSFTQLCGVNVIVDPLRELVRTRDCKIIIGQKSDTALAPDYTVHEVIDATRDVLFGADSMLNQMISDSCDLNSGIPTYAYVVPNNIGTPGEAEVIFAGVATATAPGTYYIWVNGQPYSATFDPATETDADLAQKFADLINMIGEGVTAVVNGPALTITTDSTGEIGGFLDVRTSYSCRPDLMGSPEITTTVDLTPGTGVPDLSGFPDAQCCAFVSNPYTDLQSMASVKEYLCRGWSGKGCNPRAYGVLYADFDDSRAFGQNCNNPLVSYQAVQGGLTPPYLETAYFATLAYNQLNTQSQGIAESMVGALMANMLAPEASDLFTDQQQALLFDAGIGTFDVTGAKQVILASATTTYRTANNGTADNSYKFINDTAVDAYLRDAICRGLTEKYINNGYSFRTDGRVGTRCGGKVATPEAVRNYMLNLMQDADDCNIIQDYQQLVDSTQVNVIEQDGCDCLQVLIDPRRVRPFCCINVQLRPRVADVTPQTIF